MDQVLNIFLHLDTTLKTVVEQYQVWAYFILFAIVFCETGLVIMPFLPGDSLLFAAGAITAAGSANNGVDSLLDLRWVYVTFVAAAILGDSTNYWIGRFVGPKVFRKEKVRFLNAKHLAKAHAFYERHGGKTVTVARFIPIIRTFAPFVAGIGRMNYARFVTYSVLGTLLWVTTFVVSGHYFSQWIEERLGEKGFAIIVMGIIAISLLPAVIGFIRGRFSREVEPAAVEVGKGDQDDRA